MLEQLWEGLDGLRCVVAVTPQKKLRHFFAATDAEVLSKAKDWTRQRFDVFFTPFVFDPTAVGAAREKGGKSGREAINTTTVRSFWVDLDCGPEKPYASQKEALAALLAWIKATGVASPSYIVSSGYGIHAYWLLTFPLSRDVWQSAAQRLKAACAAGGLAIDPVRTADAASILRLPGSTNFKNGAAAECRRIGGSGNAIALADFQQCLPAMRPQLVGRAAPSVWDIPTDFPPSDLAQVEAKCAQLRYVKEKGGAVEEPLWRAALSVVYRCEGGETAIHEWSKGDSRYDATETEQKAAQTRGPATCQHFASLSPRCQGCPFAGKITSPITLGSTPPEPKPPEAADTVSDDLYVGQSGAFLVTERGVLYRPGAEDSEGEPEYVTHIPLWVTQVRERVGADTADSSITLVWKALDGRVRRGVLPQAEVYDTKAFSKWAAQHNLRSQIRSMPKMTSYISELSREVIRQRRVQQYYESLGWHEDSSRFVLGNQSVTVDGVIDTRVQSSNPISRLRPKGSADAWRDLTAVLADPSLANHAFAVLCGFGSAVLGLVERTSSVVSLAGQSGYGKTLAARVALSIYGNPEFLFQAASATQNAVERQLASNRNVPYLLDEVSGMHPKRLADFLYTAANGRGKDSLTQNRETRFSGTWQLVPFVTTNRPISEYQHADIQEAHRQRLFELHFDITPSRDALASLVTAQREHYGSAGARYLEHVIKVRDKIPELFATMERALGERFNMARENRFLSWTLTAAAVGGLIAHRAGCIAFDPMPVINTVGATLSRQALGIVLDAERFPNLVADWVTENLREINIWSGSKTDLGTLNDHRNPVARYEKFTDILYIPVRVLKKLLLEEALSEYNLKALYIRVGAEPRNARLHADAPPVRCMAFPCHKLGVEMGEIIKEGDGARTRGESDGR